MNFSVIFATFLVQTSSLAVRGFSDKDLLLLVKHKFHASHDPYIDDDYYKPDAEFLRSASEKCVLNKLNLVDTAILDEDLVAFDPVGPVFGDLQEDINTLAIYVMYLCIKDFQAFIEHDFSNRIKNPRFAIPENATECAKRQLQLLNLEKPLVSEFFGLKFHAKKQCREILSDIKAVNESWDSEFRGCLKIYDKISLEYDLKFAIMNHEMPKDWFYEAEKKRYGQESRMANEQFVDCMIEKYL